MWRGRDGGAKAVKLARNPTPNSDAAPNYKFCSVSIGSSTSLVKHYSEIL